MKKNTLTLVIYTIIQWTWGILQNVLGGLLFLYLLIKDPKAEHGYYHGAVVTPWKEGKGSMGLGMFIFFGHKSSPEAEEVMVHEWGHTVQSVILGPLFVFVIGLPSLIWAYTPCFVKLREKKGIEYTDLYCEKWASGMGEKLTGHPAVWR